MFFYLVRVAIGFLCCQEIAENDTSDGDEREDDDDCDHSCVLKDDIGYVCRVCGLVQKEIQDIYEFIYPKVITIFFMYIVWKMPSENHI